MDDRDRNNMSSSFRDIILLDNLIVETINLKSQHFCILFTIGDSIQNIAISFTTFPLSQVLFEKQTLVCLLPALQGLSNLHFALVNFFSINAARSCWILYNIYTGKKGKQFSYYYL